MGSVADDQHGQIVLLHDGGGDRAQTVEALPQIIKQLKARGFRFVTVSELAGLQQSQTMPLLELREGLMPRANWLTFLLLSIGGWFLRWVFLAGIALGIARLVFIGALALAQKIRARKREVDEAGAARSSFPSSP